MTSQIFAAYSLFQGFETREYSFGLSGRSADSSKFLVTTVRSVVFLLYYTVLVCVWRLQGHVVLTDFGLCKEGVEPEGTTSTFCGTPEVSGLQFSPEGFLVYTSVLQFDSSTLGCASLSTVFGTGGSSQGAVWQDRGLVVSGNCALWDDLQPCTSGETVYCRMLHIKSLPTGCWEASHSVICCNQTKLSIIRSTYKHIQYVIDVKKGSRISMFPFHMTTSRKQTHLR